MVSRAALLLVATLGGCNWVLGLGEPHGGADAAVDVPALDGPLGAWGPRRPIPSLAKPTITEEDPFLDTTGTELYSVHRDIVVPTAEIYISTFAGSAWQASMPVIAVNSMQDDATPRLSLDGLTLYLSSTRAGGPGGATDIWVAKRDAPGAPWHDVSALGDPAVNSAANDRTLTECAGGRRVFASDRLGSIDLFEEVDGVATPITAASEGTLTESTPFITRDCLTLYFSSTRTGILDLYVATRSAVDLDFGPAARIDELSDDTTQDSDPWVSDDGRHMVFSVINGSEIDIYEADR